jgi:tRNA pseudouridine(38-40) synthase
MPRLKCIVEYDGTHFVGWQRQLNGRSVQEAIEQAIEKIAEKKIKILGQEEQTQAFMQFIKFFILILIKILMLKKLLML